MISTNNSIESNYKGLQPLIYAARHYPSILVFGLAIIVHLVVIGGSFWQEAYPEGSSDEARYVFHAETIRAGKGMHAAGREDQPTAYVMPLVPILFAFTSPHSLVGLRLVQLLFCGGVAVVTFQLGRKLFDEAAVGWLAVLFLLGNLGWTMQPLFVLTEPVFVFLLACAAGLIAYYPTSARALAGAGFFLGLAWLTRGALFGALGMLFLYLWWRAGFFKMVLVGVVLLATISPWVIRNYAAFGTFVATSTQSGNVIAGAYNDEVYKNPWGDGWINPDLLYYEEATQLGIFDDEIAYANFQSQEAQKWILANPDKLPKLWLAHFLGFIRPWFSITRNPAEFLYEITTWFVAVGLLAYGGWYTFKTRHQPLVVMWLIIIGGFALGMLFFAIPRYRLPYAPMFALIQAAAVWQIWLRLPKTAPNQPQNSL